MCMCVCVCVCVCRRNRKRKRRGFASPFLFAVAFLFFFFSTRSSRFALAPLVLPPPPFLFLFLSLPTPPRLPLAAGQVSQFAHPQRFSLLSLPLVPRPAAVALRLRAPQLTPASCAAQLPLSLLRTAVGRVMVRLTAAQARACRRRSAPLKKTHAPFALFLPQGTAHARGLLSAPHSARPTLLASSSSSRTARATTATWRAATTT